MKSVFIIPLMLIKEFHQLQAERLKGMLFWNKCTFNKLHLDTIFTLIQTRDVRDTLFADQ